MLNFFFNDRDLLSEASEYWNRQLRRTRTISAIASVIMLVIGALCLVFPIRSAYVMEVIASLVILCAGIVEIITYARTPAYLRFGGGLLSGILNIILGLMLLTSPADDLMDVFAFMIAIELLFAGISELSISSHVRFFQLGNAGWLSFTGVINIIMAVVFFFIPRSSAALLSILIGIYLITTGVSLIVGVINARELKIHKNDNGDDIIDVDVKE